MLYLKSAVFTFFCFFFYGLAIGQGLLVFPKDSSVFDQTDLQMEWNSSSGASSYDLQVSTDESFTSLVVEENNLIALSFLAQNLTANSVYYWRVKADNGSWSPSYSFTIVDFRTWPELEFMLDPDSVILDVNGRVEQWTDLSGNGHHFGQSTAAKRPTPIIDPQANNQTIIAFNPNLQNYIDGVNLSGLSQGEIFSLVKRTTYIPTSLNKGGIWKFGNNSEVDFYPSTTPSVAMGFGRNTRFIIGDISSLSDITKNHILNISSNLEFDLQINRTNIFNSNTGITNFSSVCSIGKSHGNYFFDGHFGQILLFNTVLNDSLRNLVYGQMRSKYAPPVNLGSNISQYGFCDTTLYAGKRFTSYLWSDGSTADSLVANGPGKYWVEVTDIFGFTSSDTIEVLSGLNYPTTQLYCQNDSIIWQTGLGQHYSYLWSDGSTADTLMIDSPGNIHVTVTDTNGCVFQSDTLSFAADLFSTTATLGADHDLCSGNNLSLLSGASEAVSYLWNTGSTAASIPIENSGIYSVEVTNNNGCVAKDTVEITIIGEAPVLEIDFPLNVCLSAPFEFEDVSTTTDGSTLSSWTWEFGDGNISALEEGTHYYSGLGNYEVNYTVGTTAGCYRDTTFTIAVKDNPVLSFSSSGVCQGDEVNFHGGQLSPVLISTWEWEFGDSGANNTASGQSTSHIYDSHGNYVVQLVGTDIYGCKDTVIAAKVIAPLPDVAFAFNEICEGKVVNFQNQTTVASPSTMASYTWNFGDGTTSGQTQPQKPYVAYGEYAIMLTGITEDGCSASATQNLKVHALPVVDYSLAQACAGLSTELADQSFVANGSVAQVEWSINGAPSLLGFTVEKIFDYPGSYHLKQTVKSAFGCNNAKETQIQIQEALAADFAFSPTAFVVDQATFFTNQSVGATEYEWSFGDFATSFAADTSLVFTEDQIGEEITVQLLVRNAEGCVDSTSLVRTVLGRHTDLAITELFTQETNGFLTIGVRLKNEGETPIEKVELSLRKSGFPLLKEIWTGELYAQQEEVYVFSTTLSANIAQDDSLNQFICISGRLLDSPYSESDLSNNEVCKVLGTEQVVLLQPYPNPVSDKLNLRLVLPFSEEGSLLIYDQQGRLVKMVFENQLLEEGLNVFEVDVSEVAGGKYLVVYRGSEVRVAGVVVNG